MMARVLTNVWGGGADGVGVVGVAAPVECLQTPAQVRRI